MPPAKWGNMWKDLVGDHDPLTTQHLDRIREIDRVPGDHRRHQDHQAACSVHLLLKCSVPHDPPPGALWAKEERSPQRVRPFMTVEPHFDPSSVGLITKLLDQVQGLLHLTYLP